MKERRVKLEALKLLVQGSVGAGGGGDEHLPYLIWKDYLLTR